MAKQLANERTFQGVLLSLMKKITDDNPDLGFKSLHQEGNVGVENNRFADITLISNKDSANQIFFELKNISWDATDEILVLDAMMKSFKKGQKYFVTGTPRQLAIYSTFEPNTELHDRKLKVFKISNALKNDEVLTSAYENEITPKLKSFLKELSDIVHDIKYVKWDTIDKFFVNKLSSYILEASANMFEVMHIKVSKDTGFKNRLKDYLINQDIFNVSLSFNQVDIYNICQLANYLLYLRIIFYSYLQKDVPDLKLKKLRIPEDKNKLIEELRNRFDDVLKHDFEMIFEATVLDEFEFTNDYIPTLKRHVETISNLDFKGLDCDIIGAIYNTLIDNQEQHHRGQHFTNINEVDIVNAFCINKETDLILDSGCGAGTFLVRGYQFLKFFHPNTSHENLLERLWGVEIAPFPAFLATMNLSLLNVNELDNYPLIIKEDFSNVKSNSIFKRLYTNVSNTVEAKRIDNKHYDLKIPIFDACVGNPPYIMQELIEDKKNWLALATREFGIKKINQQSDLYVYYIMHTAAFLKEGGRLGYVISDTWLSNLFGTDMQKFLLDNFKIIAIINNEKKRSFGTASVNTVILILEKCGNKEQREKNNVRFVRIYKDYEYFIGNNIDKERIKRTYKFTNDIENLNELTENEDFLAIIRNQKKLEGESTFDGKFENGNWGAKYLRSSPIYNKIISKAGNKLIPLLNFVDIKRGFTTGANEFFYVIDKTNSTVDMMEDEYLLQFGTTKEKDKTDWKKCGWYYSEMNDRHYIIEKFYFKPLFKTQKEASKLSVKNDNLKFNVLICDDDKGKMRRFKNKLLKYIEDAEKQHIHKRPTSEQRSSSGKDWYALNDLYVGDFIFPSKIHEVYGLIDNREAKVFCDKVNYNIRVLEKYRDVSDIIFLIMNSTLFRYFVELFARHMGEGLTDIDVNVVEKTLVINPELLLDKKEALMKVYKSFKNREQATIFEEVNKDDRIILDEIIFTKLGLTKKDLREFYKEVLTMRQQRTDKAGSVTKSKSKQKLSYNDTLKVLEERYPEIAKYSSLISGINTKQITIPNLNAKYPKDIKSEVTGMFGGYNVEFRDGNKKTTVQLDSLAQLKLFHFINVDIDVKDAKIQIPTNESDCRDVLNVLENEFKANISQVKNWIKSTRSTANPISLYRDLIMNN